MTQPRTRILRLRVLTDAERVAVMQRMADTIHRDPLAAFNSFGNAVLRTTLKAFAVGAAIGLLAGWWWFR